MFFKVFLLCTLTALSSSVSTSSYFRHLSDKPSHEYRLATPPQDFSNLREIDITTSKCGMYNIDIREMSITRAQRLFQSGLLTSTELTTCYIHRIEEMNPYLRAITQVNSKGALKEANQADMSRIFGYKTTGLHGIPVLLKDNIGTGDGMENTGGSHALIGLKPKHDAPVVKKLRKAGAIILGKVNLSEFAQGTDNPDGWSGIGGQTMCPYNGTVRPSSSSSGAAVAIAANLGVVAIGTETDGSISAPSSVQSLFGLKPTRHIVSTLGVIPLSFTQDTVGPMSRSALDAHITLDVIRNKAYDLHTPGQKDCNSLNIHKTCDPNLKLRVGVVRHIFWNYSDPLLEFQGATLEEFLGDLSKTVSLIDPVHSIPGSIEKISDLAEFTMYLHEIKYGMEKYLASFQNPIMSSISDIIAFNKKHNHTDEFPQDILELADTTDGIDNSTYLEFREGNQQAAKEFLDHIFETYDLDAIVGPADPYLDIPLVSSPAAIAGYPSLTVPVGIGSDGIPFGVTFVGKPYTDKVLLSIGKVADNRRRSPEFLL